MFRCIRPVIPKIENESLHMNGQQKKVRAVSKELDIAVPVGESDSQTLARAAVHPVLIAVQTTNAFKGDTAWKKLDIDMLFDRVQESVEKTQNGNLADLEAMLVAQAMTLQAIFSRLAMNASEQSNVKSYETFMGLALRAQAQSRSTIQAVVELKFPRQATFIKQGNFANGNQQVNNGIANSCTKEIEPTSANELLEHQAWQLHGHQSAEQDRRR